MIITESGIMIAIAGFLVTFYIWRWFRKIPREPDPWESVISIKEVEKVETPLCVKCLAPVNSLRQHYCPKCGNITGEFTGYIPFVNIPFQCSIFETLWSKFISGRGTWVTGIVACFLLFVYRPEVLIIIVPIILFRKFRRKPNHSLDTNGDSAGASSP